MPTPPFQSDHDAAERKPDWHPAGWHYVFFPGRTYVAVTILPDGNPACASYNHHACLWGIPIKDINFSDLKPLVCGEMQRAEWGVTGYEDKSHWCTQAKEILSGAR